jgi:hypothetical protein
VESIFDVGTFVFSSPKFRKVGLILREKHLQSGLPRWGAGECTVGWISSSGSTGEGLEVN